MTTSSRPVSGAPLSGPTFSQSVNGACPTCGAHVLWVRDHTYEADGSGWFPPLDPTGVETRVDPGYAVVTVSSSGAVAAITPRQHALHRCPAEAVRAVLERVGSMGFYTVEVLAVACPLSVCRAAPGMLCINVRREVQPRPHGARQVASAGGTLD